MWLCGRNRVVVSLMVVGLTGCGSQHPSVDAGFPGEVLARVGEEQITVDQVEKELRAQPEFVRVRLSNKDRKREFVENVIRNRLLISEARRQKLDASPDVQQALERILIQQLLKQVEAESEPTEAQAQAWYDAHIAEFSQPERVQVSMVEFGGNKPAPRAEVEKEVVRLRAAKEAARRDGFLALVQSRSTNEASRGLQGDIGPRTREELTQMLGAEAAQAAFALGAPGDLSAAVQTPRGFVIFRLTARQAAQVRDFASEKPRIIRRLSVEARAQRLDALTKSLREKSNVSIDEALLDKLDVGAPTAPLVP